MAHLYSSCLKLQNTHLHPSSPFALQCLRFGRFLHSRRGAPFTQAVGPAARREARCPPALLRWLPPTGWHPRSATNRLLGREKGTHEYQGARRYRRMTGNSTKLHPAALLLQWLPPIFLHQWSAAKFSRRETVKRLLHTRLRGCFTFHRCRETSRANQNPIPASNSINWLEFDPWLSQAQ